MPLKLKAEGKRKTYWIRGTLFGERVRESTRTSDRRIAEAMLIKRVKQIEERFLHGASSACTFGEAVDFYLEHKKPTYKEASTIIKLLDYWGPYRCTEITPTALKEYRAKRFQPDVTNATLKRNLYGPMRAILNMAHQAGLCQAISLPRPQVVHPLVRAAPEDYIAKLIECPMDKWLKAVVLTLTYHGTRPGDLARLTWADISFASSTITFGKTKNGEPHTPVMHPEVREAYLSYFAELATIDRSAPVFPHLQARDPATRINKKLAKVCRVAGIPYHSTHKIGRHAFAERIVNNGYTIRELQEAGNWKSITVVAGRYGHLERSRVDAIVSSMKVGVTGKIQTQNGSEADKEQPNQQAG